MHSYKSAGIQLKCSVFNHINQSMNDQINAVMQSLTSRAINIYLAIHSHITKRNKSTELRRWNDISCRNKITEDPLDPLCGTRSWVWQNLKI